MTRFKNRKFADVVQYYNDGLITENELFVAALVIADHQGPKEVGETFPAEYLHEFEGWVQHLTAPDARLGSTSGEEFVPSRPRMSELLALVQKRLASGS